LLFSNELKFAHNFKEMGTPNTRGNKADSSHHVTTPERKKYTRSIKTEVFGNGQNNQNKPHRIFTTGTTNGVARAYVIRGVSPGQKDYRVPAYTKPIENDCNDAQFRGNNHIHSILPIRKSHDVNTPLSVQGKGFSVMQFVRVFDNVDENTKSARKIWGAELATTFTEIGQSERFQYPATYVYTGDDTLTEDSNPLGNYFMDEHVILLLESIFEIQQFSEMAEDTEFLNGIFLPQYHERAKSLLTNHKEQP
jgi:hypothetical protein